MNDSILTVTDQDFSQTILSSKGPVLVDLWAEWCGPCRALAPTVDELAVEFAGQVTVAKLDIDTNPAIPAQYGVRGIPTILIFNDGKLVDQIVGAQSKEKYRTALQKHLALK